MSAAQIRAVHAACRELGLDAEDRHALQQRVVGKASLTEMTGDELSRVLDALNGPRRRRRRDDLPRAATAAKLRALWLSGYHLGVVRDRSDRALAAFVRRQTGLDAARWAHHTADAVRAIDGLKGWLARAAGVDWSPHATTGGPRDDPRARVLEAQWRRLAEIGEVRIADLAALDAYADHFANAPGRRGYLALSDGRADALIRHLGAWIRKPRALPDNHRG